MAWKKRRGALLKITSSVWICVGFFVHRNDSQPLHLRNMQRIQLAMLKIFTAPRSQTHLCVQLLNDKNIKVSAAPFLLLLFGAFSGNAALPSCLETLE